MGVNGRGVILVIIGFVVLASSSSSGNVVLEVHHKFAGRETTLKEVISHDANRHRRILSAAELPLGGDSRPTSAALYFTRLQIGSPPKDYHVQVDTGSDLLWVNCIECENCPKESDLGIPLRLYDPKDSSSAKKVGCDDEFCKSTFTGPSDECKAGMLCAYAVKYGDGSSTTGYFVNDNVQIAQVSGNRQTTPMSGNVILGFTKGSVVLACLYRNLYKATPPNDISIYVSVFLLQFSAWERVGCLDLAIHHRFEFTTP